MQWFIRAVVACGRAATQRRRSKIAKRTCTVLHTIKHVAPKTEGTRSPFFSKTTESSLLVDRRAIFQKIEARSLWESHFFTEKYKLSGEGRWQISGQDLKRAARSFTHSTGVSMDALFGPQRTSFIKEFQIFYMQWRSSASDQPQQAASCSCCCQKAVDSDRPIAQPATQIWW